MTPSRQRSSLVRWVRRLSVAATGVALSIVAACTLLNPLDEYGPGSPKEDAKPPKESSVDAGPSCAHARWPDPPAKDDVPGEIPDLVFALRTLDFGAPVDGGAGQVTTGFDLDNVCTCPAPATCIPPADASPCDEDGGIDEKGTDLFVSLAGVARFVFNGSERLAKGGKGLVLRLGHYNGGMNDSKVDLAFFPSLGTENDDAGDTKIPVHDGNDRWTIDKSALLAGLPYAPNFYDENAYVSDGWLVARATFPLYLGEIVLQFVDGIMVMRVAKDGAGKYTLEDGRFAGRLPARQLLSALSAFEDPFTGGGVCGDSGTYVDIKKRVCSVLDLLSDPSKDNTNVPCDSIGMTILFTAELAQFGAVLDRNPGTQYCGPNYSDDCSR